MRNKLISIEKLIDEQRKTMTFDKSGKSNLSSPVGKRFVTKKQADEKEAAISVHSLAQQPDSRPALKTGPVSLPTPTAYVSDKVKRREDYVDIRELKLQKKRSAVEEEEEEEKESAAKKIAEVAKTPPAASQKSDRKFLSIEEILAKRGITIKDSQKSVKEQKTGAVAPKKSEPKKNVKRSKKNAVDSDLLNKKRKPSFFDDLN